MVQSNSKKAEWLICWTLESLCSGKPREEENFLINFVIEAYLQLIATASLSKGLNIENLGWEAFEKGFGNKPVEEEKAF